MCCVLIFIEIQVSDIIIFKIECQTKLYKYDEFLYSPRLFKKVLSIWGWRIEKLVETKLCISELKENLKMLTAHRLDEY